MNTQRREILSSNQTHTLIIVAIVGVLALLYQQSFSFDYAHYDDDKYIIHNAMVLSGLSLDGLQWAMTTFYASNWHPLTWVSHMFDVSMFGPGPYGAHAHNTLLHGINSILVYVLLLRITATPWQAGLLAMIFLVHPLHVESVAWIAERKDLLCAVFYLAALIFYDNFRRRGKLRSYLATLCWAVLALLSKPMAVSLPVIMLLMDLTVYRQQWQPGKQTLRVKIFVAMGVEKIPLGLLTLAACVLTVLAQDGAQAVAYLESHSLTDRLETATNAYLIYIKQWLAPTNLIAFYPLSVDGGILAWLAPTSIVLGACALALALTYRAPVITLGWGWYMVSLLPVIGLVQVGAQAHADRYMYLPSIGLLLIASTLLPTASSKYFRSSWLLAIVYTLFLCLLCYWQIGTWKNQQTIFSRVLAQAGPNHKAYVHLTSYYLRHGQYKEAEKYANRGIAIAPQRSDGFQALGNIALHSKAFSQAESHYKQALSLGPTTGAVLNNLGISLAQQDRQEEAARAFKEALRVEPTLQAAQQNLRRYNESATSNR